MFDPVAEALRWWMQALDDRAFVHHMAREQRFFDKGCFIAQQAGEKALKACLYAEGQREVLGHALVNFVRDLAQRELAFKALAQPAARLDRYYIPARYPNGLPGGIPFETYSPQDLAAATEDMDAVFAVVERFLAERHVRDTSGS
jgi:HEPN domain-containing protein